MVELCKRLWRDSVREPLRGLWLLFLGAPKFDVEACGDQVVIGRHCDFRV